MHPKFFNPREPLKITNANLPHWQQNGTTYFITFRLVDSLPQSKLTRWTEERDLWQKANPPPHTDQQRLEYTQRFSKTLEHWLDQQTGSCLLKIPQCHNIVETALKHFHNERYSLAEYAIASNHVHALVTPAPEIQISNIIHSWKSYTAQELNKVDQVQTQMPPFWTTLNAKHKTSSRHQHPIWQKESYDHLVRSPQDLHRIQQYILNHP